MGSTSTAPMNISHVCVANIGLINFVWDPKRDDCLLDEAWVDQHCPGFLAGYLLNK